MTRKKTRLGIGAAKGKARKRKKKRASAKETVVTGTPRDLADADSARALDSANPLDSTSPRDSVDPGRSAMGTGTSSPSFHATRSARLPPAPDPDAPPSSGTPPVAATADHDEHGDRDSDRHSDDARDSDTSDHGSDPLPWMAEQGSARAVGTTDRSGASGSGRGSGGSRGGTRPTLMNRISRLSMDVAGRTTILELASIADSIAVETKSRVPPRFGFKVVITASAFAVAVLIITAALAIGWWRWIPLAFLFVSFLAMLGWSALRALPRLALRFGAREIPGRAAAWLTLGFLVIAGASWGVTYTVSAAAEEVGQAVWPAMAPYMPKKLVALEKKPEPPPEPAKQPKKKPRKARKVWVEPGVLYVPRTFEVVDGGFDLILFFHGNPDIVSEAVPRAGINALVHVTNLGIGSSPYQTKYLVPKALLALIAYIEDQAPKAGLPEGLKARRVALASWSAGYGALHSILLFEEQRERVDAVFLLDGIHGGFRPNTKRDVDPSTISPFVKFAEEAKAGDKLMMITHSAIPTHEYTSSTEGADAILAALEMTRADVDEAQSPPKVKFKAAVNAFPFSKRRWLKARSESRFGNFHVLGYAGNTKEDHIAHLAQMSVTALPPLKERWEKPAPADPE